MIKERASLLLLLIWSAISLSACGVPSTNLAQVEANAASRANPTPTTPLPASILSSEQIMSAFKDSGIPIINEVVYTEESDPNDLLGRPGQYVGKVNFSDKRVEGKVRDKKGFTVEVFKTLEDLEKRRVHLEPIVTSAGMFNQYMYIHKNAIVRLDHQLLPKDATQYETVLKLF